MNLKQIIDNVLSTSQLDALPEELQPASFFVWDHDLNTTKDWDDFLNGYMTCHTSWDGQTKFKGFVDMTNIARATNTSNISMTLNDNPSFTIYTSNYLSLNNKFISIGEDIEQFYLCIASDLQDFKFKEGPFSKRKLFLGKLTLVNIRKMLDNEYNDASEGPIINIFAGHLNSTIKVPKLVSKPVGQTSEPELDAYQAVDLVIPKARDIEVMYPAPAVHIGGLDFITNIKRNGNKDANWDAKARVADIKRTSAAFPTQPYYSILPTQFAIPSIDNYGFNHPADKSNEIKILLATQQLGSVAATGTGLAATGGVIGTLTSGLLNAGIGLGQKFFGDKGTLANSTAITASYLMSDNDALKFFIEGDGLPTGEINLSSLRVQNDYLELNQLNGEFGKYGKSMSPSENDDFKSKTRYRALGLDSVKTPDTIPALKVPFASTQYASTKIKEEDIKNYLIMGALRWNVGNTPALAPQITPEQWPVYIRNMFFRPDPYSFWNWPCLLPSELGVYNVENRTSIAFDTTIGADNSSAFTALSNFIGVKNDTDNSNQRPISKWTRTLTLNHITNNDYGNPNKTFSSFTYNLDPTTTTDLYKIEGTVITSSTVAFNIYSETGTLIRSQKFNSTGKVVGTSANWNQYWQL